LENAEWFFLFLSFEIDATPCPRVFRVKTEVQMGTFSSIFNAFREACAAVNGLAFSRFERHCSIFAALVAFNLKHPFLGRIKSPQLAYE
jgi:O-acetylhomoserine/O-acetylserine sulfhydrylase-like pyridoxal-dependent enzyme